VRCYDEAPGFAPARPQDRAIVGNIIVDRRLRLPPMAQAAE
jgi:hypothetical protein